MPGSPASDARWTEVTKEMVGHHYDGSKEPEAEAGRGWADFEVRGLGCVTRDAIIFNFIKDL